ncbi:MAG: hypothetical protein ChlgKO_02640 [Chlamydiales bacterium]
MLYLKGISTGDFQEALEALIGDNAKALSAINIVRLKKVWEIKHERVARPELKRKKSTSICGQMKFA